MALKRENGTAARWLLPALAFTCFLCARAAEPNGERELGDGVTDAEFAKAHPVEWKKYGDLWLLGMRRAAQIESYFHAGYNFFEARWVRTEKQPDGTSLLIFHATARGTFRVFGKTYEDSRSHDRLEDSGYREAEVVSKEFQMRWPYADQPVPFPFSSKKERESVNQVVLSVDRQGKVLGWAFTKQMIAAARKRPDNDVEIVMADFDMIGEDARIKDFIFLRPRYLDLQASYWTEVVYTEADGLAVFPSVAAYATFGDPTNEDEALRRRRAGWMILNAPEKSVFPGRDGWVRREDLPEDKNVAVTGFENYLSSSQVIYHYPFIGHRTPRGSGAEPPASASVSDGGESDYAKGEAYRKATPKNLPAAIVSYQRAANHGHAGAFHRLGVFYATGDGLPKDDAKAVECFRKSAEGGFAEAQHDLAVRYILGLGVPKDEAAGIQWYRKAAAQGYTEAIEALTRRGLKP